MHEDYTLTEMIMDVITPEPMTAKEIASAVGVKFFAGKMGYRKRKSTITRTYTMAAQGKLLKVEAATFAHKYYKAPQKFGKWTVIETSLDCPKNRFTVRCVCGRIKNILRFHLRNGESTQCATCAGKNYAISKKPQ